MQQWLSSLWQPVKRRKQSNTHKYDLIDNDDRDEHPAAVAAALKQKPRLWTRTRLLAVAIIIALLLIGVTIRLIVFAPIIYPSWSYTCETPLPTTPLPPPPYTVVVYHPRWQEKWNKVYSRGGPAGELVLFDTILQALTYLKQNDHRFNEMDIRKITNKHDMMEFISLNSTITAVYVDELWDELYDHALQYGDRYRFLTFWGVTSKQKHSCFELTQYLTPYNIVINQFVGILPKQPVLSISSTVESSTTTVLSPPWVCVWGKQMNLFTSFVLERLHSIHMKSTIPIQVHTTVAVTSPNDLPTWLYNHGVLSGALWSQFLLNCSVILGIGDPIIGPTALDAIAHGVIYIDWMYPHVRTDDNTYIIQLTSQHQYVVDMYGQPYAFAVDWRDEAALVSTVSDAVKRVVKHGRQPYIHPLLTLPSIAQRIAVNLLNRTIYVDT